VRMADEPEPTRITEAIRAQLATELPGNGDTSSDLVGLSDAFEAAVADTVVHTDGKDVLAIELDVAQTLVFAVREALRSHGGAVTFITRRAGTRPYVRRLLELDNAKVKVLATNELLDRSAQVTLVVSLDDENEFGAPEDQT
jgi:flagellar biosynthesis component FlhA